MKANTILFFLIIFLNVFENFAYRNVYWEKFKKDYNKTYPTPCEEFRRMKIFLTNLREIDSTNRAYIRGEIEYYGQVGEWSDLTTDEIISTYTGAAEPDESFMDSPMYGYDDEPITNEYDDYPMLRQKPPPKKDPKPLPDALDLRTNGEVGAVRHQGPCGSCWAHSAICCLESCVYRKKSHLYDFAEKLLVDCTYKNGRSGCLASYREHALGYMDIKFALEEVKMPYKPKYECCKWPENEDDKLDMEIKFIYVKPKNEDEIKQHLIDFGVLSLYVTTEPWGINPKGVLSTKKDYKKFTHFVNLVGWGKTEKGTPYWIIRNYWGEKWGEGGYLRYDMRTANKLIRFASTIAVTKCNFPEKTTPPPTSPMTTSSPPPTTTGSTPTTTKKGPCQCGDKCVYIFK